MKDLTSTILKLSIWLLRKKQYKKKTVKKSISKPKKQSKNSSKKPEFEKAWKEYNSALNGWKESLAQWQKATNETLMTYHEACQKALESDAELLKKLVQVGKTHGKKLVLNTLNNKQR